MRLAPGMFVRGSRGASIVGTSPLPLNIDPVPTIKVDTSLAHFLNLFNSIGFMRRWARKHIPTAYAGAPQGLTYLQLDRHNIGNGSAAVVVSMCHRDVLESDLSRASSRLTLGLCVTSESGEFLY